MAFHVHPALRIREDAAQAAGIIQTIDSQGVTLQKNQESAGVTFRPIPAEGPIIFNNTSYQPSTVDPFGNAIPGAIVV